jgi:hypothetical protein
LILSDQTHGRLSEGLSFTFAARLRVFAAHFVEILIYSVWSQRPPRSRPGGGEPGGKGGLSVTDALRRWLLFVVADWGLLRAEGNIRGISYAFVVYMISTKGAIDLMAWFVANDPVRSRALL